MSETRQIPVTIPHDLVAELWRFIKGERDDALDTIRRHAELDALLERMQAAGMADHLPTIDEVREAWRKDLDAQGSDA